MKTILFSLPLFLLLMLLSGCKEQVTFLEATVQAFAGGAPGSGGGKNYALKFKKEKGTAGKVNGIWMGNRESGKLFKGNIQVDDKKTVIATGEIPAEAEIVILNFSEKFPGEGHPDQEHAPQYLAYPSVTSAPDWLPKDFTEGCIIRIESGNKTVFLSVGMNEFKTLPKLNLP